MSELDKSTEAGRLTEVDYIEQFYSAAAGFQETLDELGPENTSIELRVSIVRELDAMCPFAGEVVCANGLAVMPKFDEDDDYVEDAVLNTNNDAEVNVHLGVAIIPDPLNSERLVIVHMLHNREVVSVTSYTCREVRKYFSYFSMSSSIIRVEDIEHTLGSNAEDSSSEWVAARQIEDCSRFVYDLLRSTKFRRLNRKAQNRKLAEIVEATETTVGIRDKTVEVLAEYGYIHLLTPATETRAAKSSFVPLSLSDRVISGECLGFGSMDQLFTRVKAIRRDSDRPDPAAGLCMLIDPHDRDSLLIPETAILYIPTNQDMGFSIPSAVD